MAKKKRQAAAILKTTEKVTTTYSRLLDEDTLFYIQGHHGKMKRSEMAKKLGMSKTILNQVILEQGLAR